MRSLPFLILILLTAGSAAAASAHRIDRDAPKADDHRVQPSVTLDVEDEDVRSILSSMQKQCAVKNLVIDPDVEGHGTFFFRKLPCSVAFQTVFESLDLAGTRYDESLMTVEKARR